MAYRRARDTMRPLGSPARRGSTRRGVGDGWIGSVVLPISEDDIEKLATAAGSLPLAASGLPRGGLCHEPPRDRARLHAPDRGRGEGARALPGETLERG